MGSPITHLSIVVLAYFFPQTFSLIALVIGSLIPDLETIFIFFKHLSFKKDLVKTYLNVEQEIMHTLLGSIFISMPIGLFATYLISKYFNLQFDLTIVSISLIIGIISHLILDLPGHRRLILFYPYIIKKNPFLFKMNLGFIERFYPWNKKEKHKAQFISEYNWYIFSHIFPIVALISVLLL